MDTDVVVAGAGPTGLLLANELALAGVDAVVL
ncbi:FAD-dependent monooxygenase, partial [Kibdelosporangium lantanae]